MPEWTIEPASAHIDGAVLVTAASGSDPAIENAVADRIVAVLREVGQPLLPKDDGRGE